MVNEQYPVEVINLMLQHYGKTILHGHLLFCSFGVLIVDRNFPASFDISSEVNHRETALLVHLLGAARPTPGASYMVSTMSLIRSCRESSKAVISFAF
jgi:hypothetical protein